MNINYDQSLDMPKRPRLIQSIFEKLEARVINTNHD